MRKLKGAVVGYGFIAEKGHVPAYLSGAQAGAPLSIVAVADISPPRRELARQAIPGARIYDDLSALLASEPDLDFLDIATPPSEHASMAHAALDRGLHVLCEKPLATSLADASSLIEHARKARRVLYPSHTYKHAPVIKAVRRAIDTGLLGDIHLVTLQTFRCTHAKGTPEWRPDWRREKRYSGGGIAMDHGSHTFYLAFDWLGGYPTSITGKMSTLGTYDTEDNFACAMSFPRGMASAHLTWTAGYRKVLYTIHGSRGGVRVEDDDVEVSIMKGTGGGRIGWDVRRERFASDWMDASHVSWFGPLLGQFARAIEADDFVGKDALDSLRCIELITTAYDSAKEGSRELPLRGA